jgi:hypothetical protein
MYHFAAHLNDRLVFRDFGMLSRVPKVLQEVSTMKFGVNIGDESRRDGGLSGNFKLIKMDNPGAYYKQLKVAVDSGTVIVMDWLFHTDTTDEQGTRAAQVTRQFLSKFPHFLSCYRSLHPFFLLVLHKLLFIYLFCLFDASIASYFSVGKIVFKVIILRRSYAEISFLVGCKSRAH